MAVRKSKPQVTEQRQFPRTETLNPANIVASESEAGLVCMILDWSHGGARLGLGNPDKCPDHFTLVTQDNRWMACEVVWRRGEQVGVRFLKGLELGE